MIELTAVDKEYSVAGKTLAALKQVDLSIAAGQMVAVVGASGAGKSTLMHILGLLDSPTRGQYHLDGCLVNDLTAAQRASLRNQQIGFVFQSFFLLPRLTALENVLLPLSYRGMSGKTAEKKARQTLAAVGMTHYVDHRPIQLSGGQQQRVAIARAMVGEPRCILADEPTGALDQKTGQEVLVQLKRLQEHCGATVVLITHDMQVAQQCQRIIKISDGSIVAVDVP